MHLYSKDQLVAASGIVGASGPAACGFAIAAQHLRPGKVAVAFFGLSRLPRASWNLKLNLFWR